MEKKRYEPHYPTGPYNKIAFVAPGPDLSSVFKPMLRSAGIEWEESLVTYLFDTDEEMDEYGERWGDPEQRGPAIERLQKELDAYAPNAIVPLGSLALLAFSGQRKISNFRGAVLPATDIRPGAKLVSTYHPEDIQKQWKLLSIAVSDFVKAAKEAARGPKIIYPKKQLLIEPSLDDLRRFATECHASDLLSVDIETGWGQITCIGFAPTVDRALCVPFVDRRKPGSSYWPTAREEVEAWKIVRDICQNPAPKLGQNFTYDAMWLFKKAGIRVRNYRHDIRLMHHNLYPELPKDLATMSASYTDVGAYKQWGGKYQAEKRDA